MENFKSFLTEQNQEPYRLVILGELGEKGSTATRLQKEASKLERIHRPCTAVHVAVGFACTKHDGAKKHLLH